MALESPLITATCVEATEFMDLARKYHVTGVPKTVVNDTIEIMGALPEDAFVRLRRESRHYAASPLDLRIRHTVVAGGVPVGTGTRRVWRKVAHQFSVQSVVGSVPSDTGRSRT